MKRVATAEITPSSLLSLDPRVLQADRNVLEQKFVEETATFISWMVHPYAISAAIACFGVAIYHTVMYPQGDAYSNATRGLWFAMAVYLLVCSWQLRDSLLVRPHPVFWRVVKGLSFLYCFGLFWLIFQNVGDARRYLAFWDPSLGVPLIEKSYATKCAVYTPGDPISSFRNVYDALFDAEGYLDTFILCHVLGWLCKMIMIRDVRLTLVASVLFEIYELTFVHMLPNFAECWWDSLILDIVVCNGAGIVAGYWWLRFWGCQEYDFLGHIDVVNPVDGKVQRRWKPLVSFRYFMSPLVVLLALAAIELNAFFLKFVLWVPPPHSLNLGRIIFWWLLGCAGTREWYHWVQRPNSPLGMMICLIFINAILEGLCAYKFSTGLFTESAPALVRWAWTIALASLASFAAIYFPLQAASSQAGTTPVNQSSVPDAEGAPKVKAF